MNIAAARTQNNRSSARLAVLLALLILLSAAIATLPLRMVLVATLLSSGGLALLRCPWLIWPGIGAALPWLSAVAIGPISLTDLALAGAVALWFVDGVRRRSLRLNGSPVLALLLIYIAVQSVSLLRAPNLVEATAEVMKWTEVALTLFIASAMLNPKQVRWLIAGLLLGGMSQAMLGLHQFINRIGPDWFIILGRYMRASGTFHQPNPFAGYLGLLLPVAVSLAIWGWARLLRGGLTTHSGIEPEAVLESESRVGQSRNADRRARMHPVEHLWIWIMRLAPALFFSTAAILIAGGLLASWSRGGWLGALGGIAVVIVLRSRTAALLSGIALLLLMSGMLLGSFRPDIIPDAVMGRVQDIPAYLGLTDVLSQPVTDENFSVVERVAHWVAALRMWEMAPWFGIGPGNYETVYPLVRLPRWAEALGHAHNIYLNTLAETGLFGLAAYLALWVGVVVSVWRAFRRASSGSYAGALALGVLGAVVHLSIHNGFDNLYVQGIYIQIALLLAAVQVSKGA